MSTLDHLINTSWLRKHGMQAFSILDDIFSEEAFFITDAERTVIFWSKGAENLLRFTKKEAVGEHCLKTNRCIACIGQCGVRRYEKVNGASLDLHDSNGDKITVKKYAHALFTRDGTFAGTFERLKPARNSAEMLSHYRSQDLHGMFSCSPKMKRLFLQIQSVAKTDVPVIARGESGTGKELLARAIHLESTRASKPFIAVNCSAIPENLIESELFGHKKGAFTGAYQDRKGLFEQADGGSLFLDEIAELPLGIQVKLLRVLETQEFQPVGSDKTITVNVRILTATHKSLREEVSQGRFREDLMYRLRVVPLFLPPLRERSEDIVFLLWHFLQKAEKKGARKITSIPPSTMSILNNHSWPGNVRELRNVVDYALAMGVGESIDPHDLPPEFQSQSPEDLPNRNHAVEKATAFRQEPQQQPQIFYTEEERIREALRISDGHLGQAAEFLGISRPTLWRKRKKYGL